MLAKSPAKVIPGETDTIDCLANELNRLLAEKLKAEGVRVLERVNPGTFADTWYAQPHPGKISPKKYRRIGILINVEPVKEKG